GEIGVRQHRWVTELTQDLVEQHTMFEALDDMAAQLGPDLFPARHRRRHVAENGLDVFFCSHFFLPGDFVPRLPHSTASPEPRAPNPDSITAGAASPSLWRTSSTPGAN